MNEVGSWRVPFHFGGSIQACKDDKLESFRPIQLLVRKNSPGWGVLESYVEGVLARETQTHGRGVLRQLSLPIQ